MLGRHLCLGAGPSPPRAVGAPRLSEARSDSDVSPAKTRTHAVVCHMVVWASPPWESLDQSMGVRRVDGALYMPVSSPPPPTFVLSASDLQTRDSFSLVTTTSLFSH